MPAGYTNPPWCECELGRLLAFRRVGFSMKLLAAYVVPGRSYHQCRQKIWEMKTRGVETRPAKLRRIAKTVGPYIPGLRAMWAASEPRHPGSSCRCGRGRGSAKRNTQHIGKIQASRPDNRRKG